MRAESVRNSSSDPHRPPLRRGGETSHGTWAPNGVDRPLLPLHRLAEDPGGAGAHGARIDQFSLDEGLAVLFAGNRDRLFVLVVLGEIDAAERFVKRGEADFHGLDLEVPG